jgi:hypothetical protein
MSRCRTCLQPFMANFYNSGDLVDTPVGMGVIPSEMLEMAWELQYGLPKNNEVRFVALKNGELYALPDNWVKTVHGVIRVDNEQE